MDELGVPFGYTKGLQEIYFTRLRSLAGDYVDRHIRISVDQRTMEIVDKVIVHELAHHLDDQVGLSQNKKLVKEKNQKGKYMPDGYARKDVGEYLACGFEIFYCGDKKTRDRMKEKNPVLYETILSVHRKFSFP